MSILEIKKRFMAFLMRWLMTYSKGLENTATCSEQSGIKLVRTNFLVETRVTTFQESIEMIVRVF